MVGDWLHFAVGPGDHVITGQSCPCWGGKGARVFMRYMQAVDGQRLPCRGPFSLQAKQGLAACEHP